jgi:hypothetical protein
VGDDAKFMLDSMPSGEPRLSRQHLTGRPEAFINCCDSPLFHTPELEKADRAMRGRGTFGCGAEKSDRWLFFSFYYFQVLAFLFIF